MFQCESPRSAHAHEEPALGTESRQDNRQEQSGKDNTQAQWSDNRRGCNRARPVVTGPGLTERGGGTEQGRTGREQGGTEQSAEKGQGEAGRRRRARPQWDLLPAHEGNDAGQWTG